MWPARLRLSKSSTTLFMTAAEINNRSVTRQAQIIHLSIETSDLEVTAAPPGLVPKCLVTCGPEQRKCCLGENE